MMVISFAILYLLLVGKTVDWGKVEVGTPPARSKSPRGSRDLLTIEQITDMIS